MSQPFDHFACNIRTQCTFPLWYGMHALFLRINCAQIRKEGLSTWFTQLCMAFQCWCCQDNDYASFLVYSKLNIIIGIDQIQKHFTLLVEYCSDKSQFIENWWDGIHVKSLQSLRSVDSSCHFIILSVIGSK